MRYCANKILIFHLNVVDETKTKNRLISTAEARNTCTHYVSFDRQDTLQNATPFTINDYDTALGSMKFGRQKQHIITARWTDITPCRKLLQVTVTVISPVNTNINPSPINKWVNLENMYSNGTYYYRLRDSQIWETNRGSFCRTIP